MQPTRSRPSQQTRDCRARRKGDTDRQIEDRLTDWTTGWWSTKTSRIYIKQNQTLEVENGEVTGKAQKFKNSRERRCWSSCFRERKENQIKTSIAKGKVWKQRKSRQAEKNQDWRSRQRGGSGPGQ